MAVQLPRYRVVFICIVLVSAAFVLYGRSIKRFHNTILFEMEFSETYKEWQKVAAHPWLFQHGTKKFLYSNLHNDLNKLLTVMSNKTNKIALIRFNHPWQVMLQNQIYTLVKFGLVYNYIVMVPDEKSLKVCFELNLPCFNGTKYFKNYYIGIDPTVDALFTDKKHYKPLNWFKLRFFLDVLIRNYTILAFDTDIAFSRKDIWLSLEKYSAEVGSCDMIFMEEAPVNAGFLYSKSNADTITLFKEWINTEYTHSQLDEQRSFGALRGYHYEICNTKEQCNSIKQKKMSTLNTNSTKTFGEKFVSVRIFPSPYYVLGTGICPAEKKLDPCISTSIYVHPICTVGQNMKINSIKQTGFWMLKEPCNKNTTHFYIRNSSLEMLDIYRCKPKLSEDSLHEKEFEKCRNDIAWTK